LAIATIAGFWELGWNTPIKELDLWKFMLREFEIEEFYMIPVSGIQSKSVKERHSLKEVLDENKDHTVVFVSELADIPLSTFVHPERALYVFGKANFSPFLNLKREKDLAVKIETAQNSGLLWPHQAAAIVLYDRVTKRWR